MKKKLCLPALGICSALAVWCFTGCGDQTAESQGGDSPNPARAVPGTEILIVADRLNQDMPNAAAWEALSEKCLALAETNPIGFIPEDFRNALGITPEGKMPDLRHMVCAVTLPKTLEAFTQIDRGKCPEGLGVYCFVGNPKINLDAVNTAVEKQFTDNLDDTVKLEKKDSWSVITAVDPDEASTIPFLAWRPIAGGVTLTLCDTRETADRAIGNTEPPAADSPLAKAFQAPSESGPWCRIVVRDVADLLNRYVDSMGRQEIMANAPFLYQVHALTVTSCYLPDGSSQLTVEANTDSASAAMQIRDMLITFKMMLRQEIAPQFSGTPYADLFSKLIDSVNCEAKENVVTLTATLTPDQAEAILDFCVTANQGALATGSSGDPFADDALYFGDYE